MCNGLGLPALLLALCEKDISQDHSVECWILNLEAPGSIPAWGELYISTFPLFPVKFRAVTWNWQEDRAAWGGPGWNLQEEM